MGFESCRAYVIVKEDGRVLVRCDAEIRIPEGYPIALSFYQKAAETATRWGEEVLGEQAKKEYAALPDFWAKARFLPLRFRLRGEPVYEDEKYFAIVCDSVLLQGNERQVRRSAQVWNKREQTILPKRQILRLFGAGKQPLPKGFREDGCYPVPGEMVFFRNPDAKKQFIEQKIKISMQ